MFHVPLDGALRAVDALKSNLLFNRAVREFLAANNSLPRELPQSPPLDEWKRLDYSTTVTRLYQIYESLVHDSISEWLADLCKMVKYSELPGEVRMAHRNGVGFIIQNIDGRRYENLSLSAIIRDYEISLSEKSPYNLLSDAFLLHNRNLRLDEIISIFRSCGMTINLTDWLKHHRLSKSESLQLIGHPTVEKCLSAFIDLRNGASHATKKVSDVIGEDLLLAYAEFIRGFCEAIVEAMTCGSLSWHQSHGHWSKVGKINLTIKDDRKICVVMVESCKLKVGDGIYLTNNNSCSFARIEEIKINDVVVSLHTVGITPQEVGLRLSVETFKGLFVHVHTEQPFEVDLPIISSDAIDIDIGVDDLFDAEESLVDGEDGARDS